MTCKELVVVLYDFLQGELEAELCQHIQHHLTQCRHCHAYLESYQITIRLSRRLSASPLPDDLAQRLRALLEEIE